MVTGYRWHTLQNRPRETRVRATATTPHHGQYRWMISSVNSLKMVCAAGHRPEGQVWKADLKCGHFSLSAGLRLMELPVPFDRVDLRSRQSALGDRHGITRLDEGKLSALSGQPSAVTQAFSHRLSAISAEGAQKMAADERQVERDFRGVIREREAQL